jgi:hypothetical protein
MIIQKSQEVEIPLLPNFIKLGNCMTSIADFSDDELHSIGHEWTARLIMAAQKRRQRKSLKRYSQQ